ncbi:MAG TPA: methyltransferase domain-containing protein [Candidatus Binataceae bacterium]|nr:methyltransferase domain-containing protein [Candidatus Binataceae bacterium]
MQTPGGKRAPARGRANAPTDTSRPRGPRRAPRPERESPAPLRLVPGLYSAYTQPGFEVIAANEIAARIAGAREVARRSIPDRAGVTIFSARNAADALARLRTTEDIFTVAGYRAGLGIEPPTLDKVRGVSRDAPFVEAALHDRATMTPGSRAGRRLRYRVVARLVGDHQFRRVDLQHAVERGIAEREDHTWRLDEEADVEFWATMNAGELVLEVRLTDERMRHREYKAAHRIAALRPSVAGALAWLSEPEESDVVLDPFCGTGTILIERAHLGRYAMLYGSDRDPAALEAARANVGPRYKPIQLERWDAAALPIEPASVSKIVTNLPWGKTYGTHGENRRLYPKWFAEFSRVLRKDGRVVALTSEWRLMRELEERGIFKADKVFRVSILGASAAVYVGRNRAQ